MVKCYVFCSTATGLLGRTALGAKKIENHTGHQLPASIILLTKDSEMDNLLYLVRRCAVQTYAEHFSLLQFFLAPVDGGYILFNQALTTILTRIDQDHFIGIWYMLLSF